MLLPKNSAPFEGLYYSSTGSTQEELSLHNWKIVDWDVKNQIKQTNKPFVDQWTIP